MEEKPIETKIGDLENEIEKAKITLEKKSLLYQKGYNFQVHLKKKIGEN